jgi:hypothetical protein
MNHQKARVMRRRPFGEVFLLHGRWEWRLFEQIGGRLLAKGCSAGNFEANRALNAARREQQKMPMQR